jgi:cation transport regulator ChaC
LGVFAYGSLVNRASFEQTLGGPIGEAAPARLRGWRRRWSLARDNLRCEKTFVRADGGELPLFVLSLNLELEPGEGEGGSPNGLLVLLDEEGLARLDRRELRYNRVEVTELLDSELACDRVFTYTAKPEHFAPTPPRGAVVLAGYVRAVETGFAALGRGEAEAYARTTEPPPVEVIEAVLSGDRIPTGNPRAW